jgi:ChrB-like protein
VSIWLLLHYKLPNKPSALRVYIWRKLKRLGAILLTDAVWVLPDLPRTAEQIQWLAAEIEEMGGSAFYWRASSLLDAQEESILRQFQEQVDAVYSDLLKQLEKSRPDLQEISRGYQLAASQDFFHSRLGQLVRKKLASKRGDSS